MQFDHYEIPRVNLLNKVADVSEDGRYITAIKDPNKRHGAALGSLSGGRVNITVMVESYGVKALAIAIRYAAVRKQFGPNENEEVPILEYQSHVSEIIVMIIFRKIYIIFKLQRNTCQNNYKFYFIDFYYRYICLFEFL